MLAVLHPLQAVVERVRARQPEAKRAVEPPATIELDATLIVRNARQILVTDDRDRAIDVARGHVPASIVPPTSGPGPYTVFAHGVSW